MAIIVVNHDYPTAGNLLAVDEDTGLPIEGVVVKVHAEDANPATDTTWIADTVTDRDGKWVEPVYLPEEETWQVSFEKPTMYPLKIVDIDT
jgi:hypothetical protein